MTTTGRPKTSPEERFWPKVDRQGPNDCWNWKGQLSSYGYGIFWLPSQRRQGAHRAGYEMFVGPVPEGMDLDHLCRNRACVNPAHLEPVSRRENLVRGRTLIAAQVKATHCPRGHEYDEINTYRWRGQRHCRACRQARMAAWYLKKQQLNKE